MIAIYSVFGALTLMLVGLLLHSLKARREHLADDAARRLGGEGPIWRTKDGRVFLIHQMDSTHLINTIRMIRRSTAGVPHRFGYKYNELLREARRRGLGV